METENMYVRGFDEGIEHQKKSQYVDTAPKKLLTVGEIIGSIAYLKLMAHAELLSQWVNSMQCSAHNERVLGNLERAKWYDEMAGNFNSSLKGVSNSLREAGF